MLVSVFDSMEAFRQFMASFSLHRPSAHEQLDHKTIKAMTLCSHEKLRVAPKIGIIDK